MVHIEDSPYSHTSVSLAYYILSKKSFLWRWVWQNKWTRIFYIQSSIPHVKSETNPAPLFINVFASMWDKFLAQPTVLILCQYSAALSRGEGADLFLQDGPFQNFKIIFQELTWSQQFMRDIVTKFEENR